MPTHYETLGVAKTATEAEIRKAYRRLARKYHPDANGGDATAEERFKEISHAHDVLSDADKRRDYDAEQSMFRGGRPGGQGAGAAGGFGDFGDIFGQMFGGRGRGGARPGQTQRVQRGSDLEVSVNITFDQAMSGVQLPVSADAPHTCDACAGSGSTAGSAPALCPDCNGRGVRGRNLGGFDLSEPCVRCHGAGTIIEDPCTVCGGDGRVLVQRRYQVKIPAGAKDGTRIRLKGKGGPGPRGGESGDLYVITRVSPSGLYVRDGDDLTIDVPVTFAEATLGAKIDIPTIDGPIKLSVPAGSDTGKVLRLRGKGARRLSGEGRGDLRARLKVVVPKELTASQQKALRAFSDMDGGNPREELFNRR